MSNYSPTGGSSLSFPLDISQMFEEFDQLPNSRFKPIHYNPFEVKRRKRTTQEQGFILERAFVQDQRPSTETRKQLSEQLGMTGRAVQVWFQNRRAKLKSKRRGSLDQVVHDLTPPRASPRSACGSSFCCTSQTMLATSSSPVQIIGNCANKWATTVVHPSPMPLLDMKVHFEQLGEAIRAELQGKNQIQHHRSVQIAPFGYCETGVNTSIAPMTPESMITDDLVGTNQCLYYNENVNYQEHVIENANLTFPRNPMVEIQTIPDTVIDLPFVFL